MTPRELVAAAIKQDLPSYDVRSYPYVPAELRRPLVVVFREGIAAVPEGLKHDLTVQLYGIRSTGSPAEAELDTVLDNVMLALQKLDTVAVTRAERKVFADVFQGWELSLTWVSVDIYKQAILEGSTP